MAGSKRELQELRREEIRKERIRKKRVMRLVKRIFHLVVLMLIIVIGFLCVRVLKDMWGKREVAKEANMGSVQVTENQKEEEENGNETDTTSTNRDKQLLKDKELEQALRALAEDDETIAEIFTNRTAYPEELLALLVNNTEMAEFVRGYLTAEEKAQGGFTKEEMEQEFPLFMQWDSRWGYVPYGGSNIGIAGCGPTCLSMVIVALTGNEEATPDALAEFSMDNGHYVEGAGTSWTLMTDAAEEYGLYAYEIGLDEAVIKQSLDLGRPVICAMREGDFTTSGHFIVLYDYDEEGFMVHDPNSRERSGKSWSFERIKYQIRNLWGFMRY